MTFRDLNVVIIETSRTNVRAGLGLHDLLKTPSVEILARVGLRRNASGEHLNKAQQPIQPSSNAAKKINVNSSRVSALPQHSEPNASVNDYLVGTALDEALVAGQDISISWPFADGDVRDWTQAEAIWKYILFNQLQRRRLQNESPVILSIFPGLARSTYERICQIFFERFNTAGLAIIERPVAQMYATNSLSGVIIDIDEEKTEITPIAEGFVVHHPRTMIPLGIRLARSTYERICQIFFERFNTAGLAIIERPVAQMYATNSLSGVIIDIDEEKTEITPIAEGFVLHHPRTMIPLGIRDCQNYLAHLLKSNQSVVSALSPPENPLDAETLHSTLLELVKQLWTDGHVKVPSDGETAVVEDEGVTDIAAIVMAGKEKAVIESGMKKKATAKASAAEQARAREIEALDLLTVQFREHSLTVGKERHRLCEPLFDPALLHGVPGVASSATRPIPLQEAVAIVIGQADVGLRQSLWGGLVVTGDLTRHVRGIGVALQSRVAPYIVTPDLQTDMQPRYARVLSVPEYFSEYRDTGNGLACFLGASITAKIIFNENGGRSYVSKADYTARGPHSIIEMTPALL
ncbi:hypothetical protein H0H92_006768 [Tricholoma furcatifolium]|nr:hypothetical protein H0H92_006768 [Tricholoma furcatifolium]